MKFNINISELALLHFGEDVVDDDNLSVEFDTSHRLISLTLSQKQHLPFWSLRYQIAAEIEKRRNILCLSGNLTVSDAQYMDELASYYKSEAH